MESLHLFKAAKFSKYSDLDPHSDWRIQNKSTLICKRKYGCKKYFLQSFLIRTITGSYELTKGFDIGLHWIRIRHHITVNGSAKMLENPGKSVLICSDFCLNQKKKSLQSWTHVSIILLGVAYTIRVCPYLWTRTQLESGIILM